MKKNISRFQAITRMGLGSFFFYLFVIGGPTWTVVGLYLMFTGAFRFCILYYYLSGGRV